jgi:hypothetical protein
MYEEEDDLPTSFTCGLGSSSLGLRMQAYYEQQYALRNAMSFAAAGGNLNSTNTTQPPLSLRDYYLRFAQQYPLSLTSNQYLFPTPQIPMNVQHNVSLVPSAVLDPTSPSMSSSNSNSPTKSPIVGNSVRRLSVSSAPYSASNSQRNRRLSPNYQTEPMSQTKRTSSVNFIPKTEPVEYSKPQFTEDIYTAQPFQSPIAPFTTQLPNHMQQYHLPDFVSAPNIPTQSISLDKIAVEDNNDLFANNDWANFLSQVHVPNKLTPYEDNTNWDDYLDGDANWLLGSQPDQES